MNQLGCIYDVRDEPEQAVEWFTKGADAGLPRAMFYLGVHLDEGTGVAAPDSLAAAGWHRRAANAGDPDAAQNLSILYTLGRGKAWQADACHVIHRI
jgi:hypothetical protein